MNKVEQIEGFLKYISKLLEQNPHLKITDDLMYDRLMNYGLNNEEVQDPNIKYLFSNWINKYQSAKNLHVYESNLQPGFLQFRSRSAIYSNVIKLYLSFPKDKMEQCVNIIFDFIEQNNIMSASKVSQRLRSDSVVLRLTIREEANKVINFINQNSILCYSAKPTNPFVMKIGICGVGYDDMLSYNSCVSYVLAQYFQKLKQENRLSSASHQDFYQFVYDFHHNSFIICTSLEKFIKNPHFQQDIDRQDNVEQVIVNWEQIIELFVNHLYSDMTMSKYYQLYDTFGNQKDTNNLANQYHNIVSNINPDLLKNGAANKKKIVEEYIQYGMEKYGIEGVKKYLDYFKDTGSYNYITRENNFRTRFIDCQITPNFLKTQVNINEMINDINEANLATKANCETILKDYIDYGITAYGVDTTIAQLEQFMRTNNYNLITRKNGLRDMFIKNSITGIQIDAIVNHNIKEYVQKINNSKNNYQIFLESCTATYTKYGKEQLVFAIKQAFNGNNNSFTNGDKNYREQLNSFLRKENILYYCELLLFNFGYDATIPTDISISVIVGGQMEQYYAAQNKMRENKSKGGL